MAVSYDKPRTFCLIYAITPAAEEAFMLPHNEKYLVSSQPRATKRVQTSGRTTPPADNFTSVIALTFDIDRMIDPADGHVFGSGKECDVRLAMDNMSGVSKTHFSLCLEYDRHFPSNLNIKAKSGMGVQVGGKRLHKGKDSRLPVGSRTTVQAGQVYLEVLPLEPRLDDPTFMSNWEIFKNHAAAAGPTFAGTPLRKTLTGPTPHVVHDNALKFQGAVSGDTYEVISSLTSPLGTGGFGVVVKVSRLHDGKIMAMKKLRNADTGQKRKADADLGSLLDELAMVRRVSHEYICAYVDYTTTVSGVNLFLELAEHGDLRKRLNWIVRQSEQDAGTMAKQLLKGLQYLHSHDIMHRDIKPANILIFGLDPPVYKLVDFGLSKLVEASDTPVPTICGTWEYCAPEVFAGAGGASSYGMNLDIWALGTVLWEALTGERLFSFRQKKDQRLDRANVRATLLKWIPDVELLSKFVRLEGKDLILGMLEKDPAKRPSATDCIDSHWFFYLVNPSSVYPSQADSQRSVATVTRGDQLGSQTEHQEPATGLLTEHDRTERQAEELLTVILTKQWEAATEEDKPTTAVLTGQAGQEAQSDWLATGTWEEDFNSSLSLQEPPTDSRLLREGLNHVTDFGYLPIPGQPPASPTSSQKRLDVDPPSFPSSWFKP